MHAVECGHHHHHHVRSSAECLTHIGGARASSMLRCLGWFLTIQEWMHEVSRVPGFVNTIIHAAEPALNIICSSNQVLFGGVRELMPRRHGVTSVYGKEAASTTWSQHIQCTKYHHILISQHVVSSSLQVLAQFLPFHSTSVAELLTLTERGCSAEELAARERRRMPDGPASICVVSTTGAQVRTLLCVGASCFIRPRGTVHYNT